MVLVVGVKEMQVTTQKTPLNEVGRQGHRFYAHWGPSNCRRQTKRWEAEDRARGMNVKCEMERGNSSKGPREPEDVPVLLIFNWAIIFNNKTNLLLI